VPPCGVLFCYEALEGVLLFDILCHKRISPGRLTEYME
jgi:hypothetical protein